MRALSLSSMIVTAIAITGCSSLPRAEKLSDAETAKFLNIEAAQNGAAIVFFTCGESRVESLFGKTANPLHACALEVNGTPHRQLVGRDLAGRITLPPGTYKMQSVPEDSLTTYIPIQLELRGGDVVLVTQYFSQKVGPLGGALSSGFTQSLAWTKDAVLQKISRKTPHGM